MTIEVKINMTRILTLSEEASKILEFKTSQSGMATTSDMLEWIIKFFGKTSNEDKQKWKEKKDNARSAFLTKNFPISTQAKKFKLFEQIWNAGFGEGWLQFQTRNSFVKNSPKGIKRKPI